MKHIGFLISNNSPLSPEEKSAWKFLSKQHQYAPIVISFEEIYRRPSLLNTLNTLWWHYDESTFLPSIALDPEVLASIRTFIERGGSLLLSLLSAQYTINLGIESRRPNVLIKGHWQEACWAQGYADIRGFASYFGHPIIDRFGRGVFAWNPEKGNPYSACYYDGVNPEKGKVVAVERQYIKLAEAKRIISEYSVGKGKLLSVGAYLYFRQEEGRFRKHLEQFTLDTLEYLYSPQLKKVSYWPIGKQTVQEFKFHSHFAQLKRAHWNFHNTDLQIERDRLPADTDQSYDVGGRRILVLGTEQKGISEIWSFPIRIASDVRIGVHVTGHDLVWLDLLPVHLTVRPESITREYSFLDTKIQEITFTDEKRPAAAIQIIVKSTHSATLIVTASIDLRIMWPLSEYATGSMQFAWDEEMNAGIVTDLHGHLSAIIGTSLTPSRHLLGQYQSIDYEGDQLIGTSTDQAKVSVGLSIPLPPSENFITIAFAGSTFLKESIAAFKWMITDASKRLKEQVEHFNELWQKSIQIDSPDQEFNTAYRWALTATDRFTVETPELGTSLMAGFGSSASGWNGGHTISGRPGYAWYFGRDSVWSSLALLAAGDAEKVRNVLEFLGRHQDLDGKILHEATTSGHIHYDAADSTPLYLLLMGRYYQTSGDLAFVRKEFSHVLKAMKFCFSTDTNGDHLIENTTVGHGWIEGGILFPVHAEYYLEACWCAALQETSALAAGLRKPILAQRWRRISMVVKKKLEKEFWNWKTRFYNFGKLADGRMNTEKTMLPTVGMYLGVTDRKKSEHSLEDYSSQVFSADWGVRMVGSDNPLYNPNGYHYGSIWPLFTGWTALAEYSMDRPIQAYNHLQSTIALSTLFSAGSVPEVLHGEQFQLSGVCPHQCWSETMVLLPILEGMLGLKINAIEKSITLKPAFPSQWKYASVKNMLIGSNRLSLSFERIQERTTYKFSLDGPDDLIIHLIPHFNLGTRITKIQIGKRKVFGRRSISRYQDLPNLTLRLKDELTVTITHNGGVGVAIPRPQMKPGKASIGLRLISEQLIGGTYKLRLEGKCGRKYSFHLHDPDKTIQSVRGGNKRLFHDGRVHVQIQIPPSKKGKCIQQQVITISLKRKR
ncbi:MAG: DUF4960 domain-containing protein [bacterium]